MLDTLAFEETLRHRNRSGQKKSKKISNCNCTFFVKLENGVTVDTLFISSAYDQESILQ